MHFRPSLTFKTYLLQWSAPLLGQYIGLFLYLHLRNGPVTRLRLFELHLLVTIKKRNIQSFLLNCSHALVIFIISVNLCKTEASYQP